MVTRIPLKCLLYFRCTMIAIIAVTYPLCLTAADPPPYYSVLAPYMNSKEVDLLCRGGCSLGGNSEGAYEITIPAGTTMSDGTVLKEPLAAVYTRRGAHCFNQTVQQLQANPQIFPKVYGVSPESGAILMESMRHSRSGIPVAHSGDLGYFHGGGLPLAVREQINYQGQWLMAMHPDGHPFNVMAKAVPLSNGTYRVEVKCVDPDPCPILNSEQIAGRYNEPETGAWAQYHPSWQAKRLQRQLNLPDEPPVTIMCKIGEGYGQACTPPSVQTKPPAGLGKSAAGSAKAFKMGAGTPKTRGWSAFFKSFRFKKP